MGVLQQKYTESSILMYTYVYLCNYMATGTPRESQENAVWGLALGSCVYLLVHPQSPFCF